jgi:hypothetical protein
VVDIRWTCPDGDDHLGHLAVPGRPPIPPNIDGDGFTAPIAEIEAVTIAGLRRSLRRCRQRHVRQYGSVVRSARMSVNPRTGEPVQILITDLGPYPVVELVAGTMEQLAAADDYSIVPEPLRLVATDSAGLALEFETVIEEEDEPDLDALRRLLLPELGRHRLGLSQVNSHAYGEKQRDYALDMSTRRAAFWVVTVEVTPPSRGGTVGEFLERGRSVLALLEAAGGRGRLDVAGVRGLIAGGRSDLLIGQRESSWLECKRALYRADEHGQYELTKDVAALANASGGLIVIGAECRKRVGHEEVVALPRVQLTRGDVQRYRAWIANGIYPRPQGVVVEAWPPSEGEGLITIFVRDQPSALRPFVTGGASRRGHRSDLSILIPFRHDDDTVFMSREELHATLVAGRAALAAPFTRGK